MLINVGLGLFVFSLFCGTLAGMDLTPLAHDIAAVLFVGSGAASAAIIAIDLVLAFIASMGDADDDPGGRLVPHA